MSLLVTVQWVGIQLFRKRRGIGHEALIANTTLAFTNTAVGYRMINLMSLLE